MSCVFCDIVSGVNVDHEVLWQDEQHVAFLSKEPAADGHTLVIPKKHTEYVFAMDDADYHALMNTCKAIAGPLKEATGKEKIVMTFEGFMVPHVHAHLVPDNATDNRVRFLSHKADHVELREIAATLRPHFI